MTTAVTGFGPVTPAPAGRPISPPPSCTGSMRRRSDGRVSLPHLLIQKEESHVNLILDPGRVGATGHWLPRLAPCRRFHRATSGPVRAHQRPSGGEGGVRSGRRLARRAGPARQPPRPLGLGAKDSRRPRDSPGHRGGIGTILYRL